MLLDNRSNIPQKMIIPSNLQEKAMQKIIRVKEVLFNVNTYLY